MRRIKEQWEKASNADKVVLCLQGANVVLAVALLVFRLLVFKDAVEEILG